MSHLNATPAVLTVAMLPMVLAAEAGAKPFCPPEIVGPEPGARTSTTPTIEATAADADCDPNVKKVSLEIEHVPTGNIVYEWENVRGKGLFTGRGYTSGMLLVDHTVPEGELQPGEEYEARVEYGNKPSLNFNPFVGIAPSVRFTTQGSAGQVSRSGRSQHTIVISGRNTRGGTDYTVSGGGDLEQVSGTLDGVQVSVQGNDSVEGNLAQGHVGGGADGFRVYGDVPGILLNDPENAEVFVDGAPFHTIVISGRDTPGETSYTISGGGELEQVEGRLDAREVSIQSNDNVRGTRAEGNVGGAADGFRVYGERPDITLHEPRNAHVYVNGKRQ